MFLVEFKCELGRNPMMVDKTGVGPEGEDVAVEPDSTDPEDEHEPESIEESPCVSVKHEDSLATSDKSPCTRTKSNQRWMKLRTTVQLSGAISSTIQKSKPPLKREDSFLKRFSTRQVPETQETMDTGDDGEGGSGSASGTGETARRRKRRRKHKRHPRTVVNPDENFYFYWLMLVTICVLYNLWTLIVRQSFPELQERAMHFWFSADLFTDVVCLLDVAVQFRTGYLEQGLMVYDSKKLAGHYIKSRAFLLDLVALLPLDLLQFNVGVNPILRFPRFLKVYRVYDYYYMVESRTVYPNLWRVMNLIHILLILAHWFGCFYYLLSEAEGFQGDWVYPYRPGDYATLSRKYLGSLYWSTLTLTTIGDLPTPETNAEFIFTIVSYLIGVFIFATIVGQVGNVITNRNANRLEFERLLDGAKTYMRHHKVPGGMKRRVLRWYDYSWSRGRIQGGGDINTALGLLPDKLKTELALHVNLSVLKKVTIFQECQPEFLHDLVLKMKAYIFTPGDLICRKGEVAREMFIIADGILEVKSETGRVLTTMKAGDFFGEIGILNLDGLNRRTADVRSVGYSELFSLSREDVLAAMKDYPEAQDILQTLGRKRLMEARNVNRGSKSHGHLLPRKVAVIAKRELCVKPRYLVPPNTESEQSDDGPERSKGASSPGPSELFDHRTGKKIVEKIRSDVKGLRNVLRKSRRVNRSRDEAMELQPLTNSQDGERYYREGKGVLCRMPRVASDDTSQEDEPYSPPAPPDTTKIGAGLPLLQRLKLLKEKQDKEAGEKSKIIIEAMAPPLRLEEPEVIGAGLPLLQRLLLLKQKEDREREANTIQTTANETAQVLATTVRTQLRSPSLSFKSQRSKERSKEDEIPLKPIIMNRVSTSKKPKETGMLGKNGGVSWKDDCNPERLEPVKTKPGDTSEEKGAVVISEAGPSKKQLNLQESDTNKQEPSKPLPKGKKFQSMLKQAGMGMKTGPQVTRKPTVSIVESVKKPEHSGSDNSPSLSQPSESSAKVDEVSPSPAPRPSKQESEATTVSRTCSPDTTRVSLEYTAKEGQGTTRSHPTSPLETIKLKDASDSSNTDKSTIAYKEKRESNKSSKFAQDTMSAQSNSISKDNNSNISSPSNKDSVLIEIETSSDDQLTGSSRFQSFRRKPTSLRLKSENKMYRSIDDLSPEFSGLPFVKQLKVLNERQKVAELTEKAFIRSSSLDSGGRSSGTNEFNQYSPSGLTRSNSEAIAMEVVLRNQHLRAKALAAQHSEIIRASGRSPSPDSRLTSPESNETVERRNLKSILKKLSSTKLTVSNGNINTSENQAPSSTSPSEMRKLMRAQTVEGYAARHSKFSKSVTFNRETVQSPTSSIITPTTPDLKPVFTFSKASCSLDAPVSERTVTRISSSLEAQRSRQELTGSVKECVSVHIDCCTGNVVGVPLLPSALVTAQSSMSVTTDTVSTKTSQISELRTTNCTKPHIHPEFKDSKSQETQRRTQGPWMGQIESKQKNFFRPGSIFLPTHEKQEEEFFGEILGGIKSIIQNHLEDIQNKFVTRFHDLELEVKKRDDIIARLQGRIEELENTEREESSDMDDSTDAPFMRGDSVDTIISSPRRSSKRWLRDRLSWEDRSEEENLELMDLPRSITPQPLWNSNSTSIDMGSDSSSSYSTSETDDVFATHDGEHNDWEVQMLAKEMEQRESLQDQACQLPTSTSVRRRAVSCDSETLRYKKPSGKRTTIADRLDAESNTALQSAQSLEERTGTSGLSALYRSLSIGNLHTTFSNGLLRGLGTFVRGNVPQTVHETNVDVVPTISSSCLPPPPPPPLPPDV